MSVNGDSAIPEDPWGVGVPVPAQDEPRRRRGLLRRMRGGGDAPAETVEVVDGPPAWATAPGPLPPLEPPRGRRSLGEAVRQRPWLLALCMVAFTGAGLVAGIARTPVYTAEARSAVSRIDVSTQSLPGFAAGVQTLAVAYSRIIGAQQVVDDTAARLGETPDAVAPRISASPVPESPLFRVFGTGSSPEQAVATANAASQALRRYVTDVNVRNPDATRIFARFRAASAARERARARVAAARAAGDDAALTRARADLAAAELEVDTLRQLYQQSLQGTASASVIQVITPARTATSDRRPVAQRLALTGLVTGLLVGLALCMLLPGPAVPGGYVPRHARR